MILEGQFPLDKVLKDKRKAPKDWEFPKPDVVLFDQHREKLPDGRVKEKKGQAKGVVKKVWVDHNDGYLKWNWKITDQNLLNLVNELEEPEKFFKYSPEHIPKNKSMDYPQGEIGILDAIAITNIPNADDAITTRVFNSFKDWFIKQQDYEDPMVLNEGEIMEKDEVVQIVQNELSDIDVKPQITEVMNEKLEAITQISEGLAGVDFEKVGKNLEKLNGLDFDKIQKIQELDIDKLTNIQETVNNIQETLDKPKEKIIQNIVENSNFERAEIEQFSMESLQELAGKLDIKMDGVGEIIQNKEGTPESDFEDTFGVKMDDLGTVKGV